jgi:hypothetical protein
MNMSAVLDREQSQANPFGSREVTARTAGALVEVEQQRAIAETQASMVIAKRFPRNEAESMDKILQACTRPGLAESALYSYSRGGTEVTGPSIRLAEAIGQHWKNLQFGIREISQKGGESEVEAFAWDVENNTRQVKVFRVPHVRYSKSKGNTALTDPRDVYELVANQGARRLRACILGIIPGDVVEAAVKQCEMTLNTKAEVTPERLTSLLEKFLEFGVTKEMIEKRIQRRIDAMTPALMVQIGKIFNSLKDGMSGPADWFEIAPPAEGEAKTGAAGLKGAIVGGSKGKTKEAAAATGDAVSPLDQVRRICEAATAIKEKEVAHLKLDDARFAAKDLTGDEKAQADKLILEAVNKIEGKLV